MNSNFGRDQSELLRGSLGALLGDSYPERLGRINPPVLDIEEIVRPSPGRSIPLTSNAEMEFASMVFQDGTRRYPTPSNRPTSDPILSGGIERERLIQAAAQAAPGSPQEQALQQILNPNASTDVRLGAIMGLLVDPTGQPLLQRLVDQGIVSRDLLQELVDAAAPVGGLGGISLGSTPSTPTPARAPTPPPAAAVTPPKAPTPPPAVAVTPPSTPAPKAVASSPPPAPTKSPAPPMDREVLLKLATPLIEKLNLSGEVSFHKGRTLALDYDEKANTLNIPKGRAIVENDWNKAAFEKLIGVLAGNSVKFADPNDRMKLLESIRDENGNRSIARLTAYALALNGGAPSEPEFNKLIGTVQKIYTDSAGKGKEDFKKMYDKIEDAVLSKRTKKK